MSATQISGDGTLRLGAFALDQPVARGGTAEVWRGVHAEYRTPVAVKVLTAAAARDSKMHAAIRNEVRAVARLDHPRVVLVFDQGTVDEAVEQATQGRLAAGSPYLVMEWASAGTLAAARPPRSWSELFDLLVTLLDALAHAHARGVIHRDIKPGNILVCADGDARPGIKVADFGIARPRDAEAAIDVAAAAGTLAYMAPEQAAGLWHDQGPWTDLYALGCLAFRLATGAPPFTGTAEEVFAAHVARPAPRLVAQLPVPDGFADWVARLLEKDWTQRFSCAADAAHALAMLGEPDVDALAPSLDAPAFSDDLETLVAPPPFATLPPGRSGGPAVAVVPPMPASWRSPRPPRQRSMRLLGTGLGLFGLRTVPLVDRDAERDALWAALRRVRDDGQARAALLQGPTGTGKSRMAEWLGERAFELGAATVLKAAFAPGGESTDPLAAMLARHLGAWGLASDEARPKVDAALASRGLDADERAALVELVAPAPGAPHAVHLYAPRERHEAVRRYLEAVAEERPVVVWLDDVQWSLDALAFTRHVLDTQHRHPAAVLVVATVNEEAIADRAEERDVVAEIARRDDTVRVAVGPLPAEHRGELVRALIGLEGELAAALELRAAHNPLFAVQLVDDWVQRGLLEPTDRGLALRAGAEPSLPQGLHEVWTARLDQLLDGRSDDDTRALELAALLGHEVDADEWAAASRAAGVIAGAGLVDALLDRRLATPDPRGFAFAHGMVRESLERRAAARGDLPRLHRACADALGARASADPARVGRHLLGAGDGLAAAGPLLAGARRRLDTGDFHVALALLVERARALDAATGVAPAVRCDGLVERALAEANLGRGDEAFRWACEAEAAARDAGLEAMLAKSLLAQGRVQQRRGMLAHARAECEEALAICERLDDRQGQAQALHWLGIVAIEQGDRHAATELQERALARFEALGDAVHTAHAHYELGVVHRHQGDRARARALAEKALDWYERAGMRNGAANAMVSLGELARDLGDFDEAERQYRRALAIYERTGSGNAMIAQLNLALALLGRRDWVGARALLEDAHAALERSGWWSLVACALVELLPCDAAGADWARWDDHRAQARDVMASVDFADPDLAWAAELAGDLAGEHGELERARDVFELALAQWRRLDRREPALRVEGKLAAGR